MAAALVRREVLPFLAMFGGLIGLAIMSDWGLHRLQLVWVGRYLGIVGTGLIVISFGYSFRKRKLWKVGAPQKWLRFHELTAWLGALLILVHGGVHFRALLPWLALGAMLVAVASGLTGKFLLAKAQKRVASHQSALQEQGLTPDIIQQNLFWDAVMLDMMKQWRVVHLPITLAFAFFALAHIFTILFFWGGR